MTKPSETDKSGIIISPTDEKLDTFTTVGVADALESVFRHRPFEFDDDSREYAEVARAYWLLKLGLPELFRSHTFGPFPPSEVSANVALDTGRVLRRLDQDMDVLVRRIILGMSRIREDLDHVSALIAFKQSGNFSTSSHADLISKDDDEKTEAQRQR